MGNTKTKVSVTLDSDLIKTLRQQADKEDRSFSQYINYVLKQHETKRVEKNMRNQFRDRKI